MRYGIIAALAAAVLVAVFFLPGRGEVLPSEAAALQKIHARLRDEGDKHPKNYGELEALLGREQLTNPTSPDDYPWYALLPLTPEAANADKLIWVYEKQARTLPEGRGRYVLQYNGTISGVDEELLRDLLNIQGEYMDAEDDIQRAEIYRQFGAKWR